MNRSVLVVVALTVFLLSSCKKDASQPASTPDPTVPDPHIGADNSVVFVASENGKLYALDANSGAEKWTFILSDTGIRTGQFSSPAYADGMLYVGSSDRNIYAVNAATGKEVWHYPTNSYPGYFFSSPVVVNGVVYLPGYESKFYALNAKTGGLKWAKDFPREFESSPAYSNGKIFITSNDGVLYALDTATGNTIWYAGGAGADWGWDYAYSSPCLKNGVVYALTDNEANSTAQLNELSGEDGSGYHGVYASYYIPSHFTFFSSPVMDDSVVYFGGLDSNLYAAKIGDLLFYNKKWSFKAGAPIYSSPAFDDSTVYVGANDGYLYAIRKDSGTLKWKYNAESIQVVSSPVVSNGVVFCGGYSYFFALYARDGSVKWKTPANIIPVSSSPVLITKQGKAIHGGISGMTN